MLVKDFIVAMANFSINKPVITMQAHLDPFYYDSSDTVADSVILVIFDECDIWEIVETDSDNEIVKKVEVVT